MYYIIYFGHGEYGLYVSGYRNSFGTPLYCRGTLDEVLEARRGI